jgi:hypothetical protein
MKNKELVKITSIALALVSLTICIFIWGQVSGLEKGYLSGVLYPYQPTTPEISFSGGLSIFDRLNNWYFIITVGFCIYIIGKFLKSLIVSTAVCFLSLSIALYPFLDMLLYKNQILSISGYWKDNYWLNISIYFDWYLLIAALILMFIQFLLVITRKLKTETFKIN